MQSATTLIGRVQSLVKDGSFDSSFILELLNDGIFEVAIATTPPSLVSHDVRIIIPAGADSVIMPSDFFGPRILSLVSSDRKERISVLYRIEELQTTCKATGFSACNMFAVLKGNRLLVSERRDSSYTLLATYNSTPIVFESIDDSGENIDFLPIRLGEISIVNYAAWRIYSHIEDGVDGKKVNSETYQADFLDATAKIMNYFGMEAKEQEPELVSDLIGISGDIGTKQAFVGKL